MVICSRNVWFLAVALVVVSITSINVFYLVFSNPWKLSNHLEYISSVFQKNPFKAFKFSPDLLVYIVYHDQKSKLIAEKFSQTNPQWTKAVKVRSTVYFESVFFRDILTPDYHIWASKDYVGMISYRAIDISINNMSFKADDIPTILRMSTNESAEDKSKYFQFDVIPFLQGINYTLMDQAILGHGIKFKHAWDSLLQAMGNSEEQIRKQDIKRPFLRNSFIAKPYIMKKYCSFLSTAMVVAEYNATVKSLMDVDASYDAVKPDVARRVFNKEYYMMHPFIFERLPIYFFNQEEAKIFSYPNLRSKREKRHFRWF